RGHELTLEIRPGAGGLQIDGDADRLVQVFSNLLSNSAKYTDKGGRIHLTLDREGSEVVVKLQDNGIGIPPQALERVFEMFSQAHSREQRADGGLVIGLSLVRTLVQMHNGSVTALSDGLGTGSTFTVRLPLAWPRAATPIVSPGAAAAQRPAEHGVRRVLVVDDSADAAASLMTLLALEGHEVRTAGDGV